LGVFWVVFEEFLVVFMGFENIVGGAQSVFENIVGGAQSVVNGTQKKGGPLKGEGRGGRGGGGGGGTLCAPTRGHPYFGSLLEPQGFP